jgi:hypothetical protein
MTRLILDLPDDLADWIAAKAGSGSPAAWLAEAAARLRAQDELDRALDEGLASGDCEQSVDEVFAEIRRLRPTAA